MTNNYCLIINPKARSGKNRKNNKLILDTFRTKNINFTVHFSEHKQHAVALAKAAREEGYKNVVAVGGDGTICEVVTGLFLASDTKSMPNLGIIHTGTSPDFNKHHNIPIDIAGAINTILAEKTKTVDAAKITYYAKQNDNQQATAFFVSNTNIGLGPSIISRTNSRYRKYLGDFLGTLSAMLVSLVGFKPQTIKLKFNGAETSVSDVINLTIGKDPYIGSGMRVFNDVAAADGRMYVLTVAKTTWQEFYLQLHKIYTGNFLEYPGATMQYTEKIEISGCDDYPLVECDGDIKGYLPATIEILPRAINVLM